MCSVLTAMTEIEGMNRVRVIQVLLGTSTAMHTIMICLIRRKQLQPLVYVAQRPTRDSGCHTLIETITAIRNTTTGISHSMPSEIDQAMALDAAGRPHRPITAHTHNIQGIEVDTTRGAVHHGAGTTILGTITTTRCSSLSSSPSLFCFSSQSAAACAR